MGDASPRWAASESQGVFAGNMEAPTMRELIADKLAKRFLDLDPISIADSADKLRSFGEGGGTLAQLRGTDNPLHDRVACYSAASGVAGVACTFPGLVAHWFDLADLIQSVQAGVLIPTYILLTSNIPYKLRADHKPCHARSEWVKFWHEADTTTVYLVAIQLSQDGGKTYADPFAVIPDLRCFECPPLSV